MYPHFNADKPPQINLPFDTRSSASTDRTGSDKDFKEGGYPSSSKRQTGGFSLGKISERSEEQEYLQHPPPAVSGTSPPAQAQAQAGLQKQADAPQDLRRYQTKVTDDNDRHSMYSQADKTTWV